jgi:hypothetical protein
VCLILPKLINEEIKFLDVIDLLPLKVINAWVRGAPKRLSLSIIPDIGEFGRVKKRSPFISVG